MHSERARHATWCRALVVVLLASCPASMYAEASTGCLEGHGYLRARLRGALTLDLDWRDAEMQCEGGLRPDGRGMRVSIAGPERSDGRRLRFVFGIANAAEGTSGRALPTNLTVIFEGEKRLFATRGDDKCTVDALRQERIGALGGPRRTWKVIARGFCTTPAASPERNERLLVTSFDFTGRVSYEDEPAGEAGAGGPP